MNSFNQNSTSLKDFSSTEEVEVWARLKAGDKRALSFIYTKYFDNLYNYGQRITSDSGLTEDSIQDLFIEFWNKREGISDVNNVKYYLYKSLRRKIIYTLSVKAKHPETDDLKSFEVKL